MALGPELIAKLGLDNSAFERGLRASRNQAKDFANSIKSDMAAAFTGAGVYAFTKSLGDLAEQITNTAENLGVSTDFLQGFQDAAEKSGISTEKATSALEKFSVKIAEAREGGNDTAKTFNRLGVALSEGGFLRSTNDILLDVSDRLKAIPDAGERAAIAVELFGKGAQTMGAFLSKGRVELDGLIQSADKFSTETLAGFREASLQIKDTIQAIQIAAGNAIRYLSVAAQFAGAFSARKDTVDTGGGFLGQLKAIPRAAKEALRDVYFLQNAFKQAANPVTKIRDTGRERTAEEIDKERRANLDAALKEARIRDTQRDKELSFLERRKALTRDIADTERSIGISKTDRARFTLEELATSGVRFSGRLGAEQLRARQAFRLEKLAEANRLRGFGDLSLQQFALADQLRAGITNLRENERFPFRGLEQRAKEQSEALQELVRKANAEGININPKNGQ